MKGQLPLSADLLGYHHCYRLDVCILGYCRSPSLCWKIRRYWDDRGPLFALLFAFAL